MNWREGSLAWAFLMVSFGRLLSGYEAEEFLEEAVIS